MEEDLFKSLPLEIITNILLRLPVQTIAFSKCVCKSWLDLVDNDEFAKFHLSRSAAAVAVLRKEGNSSRCAVFELGDEIDAERSHDHHYNHLTRFNFPHSVSIVGSANGMLLLHQFVPGFDDMYVCNPISREYIELPCPQGFYINYDEVICGFGASKISGQHKVVRIIPRRHVNVYTLGTGLWRRVEEPSALFDYFYTTNAFVNGNLHWCVFDENCTALISCFDLETESFSTFPAPGGLQNTEQVFALRDCLCVCDFRFDDDENVIDIWLMTEYGDEKSWTKEYVVNLDPDFLRARCYYPIKVFKDGDILVIWDGRNLFYYSNKTKTGQEIGVFDEASSYQFSALLTPSFLSLKSFGMENVISLLASESRSIIGVGYVAPLSNIWPVVDYARTKGPEDPVVMDNWIDSEVIRGDNPIDSEVIGGDQEACNGLTSGKNVDEGKYGYGLFNS